MGFVSDFKAFALKGNVVELATAVIIGAAFGAIVSSLAEDVITPLILKPALDVAGVADLDKLAWGTVKYGKFLAAVIKFLLIALVLFSIIRALGSMMRKKEEAPAVPAAPSSTDALLMEIRDELKRRG